MKLKKSVIFLGVFLLIIALLSATLLHNPNLISSSGNLSSNRTIILDAGHGGLTNTID